jgi:hypothetical protein
MQPVHSRSHSPAPSGIAAAPGVDIMEIGTTPIDTCSQTFLGETDDERSQWTVAMKIKIAYCMPYNKRLSAFC